MYYKLISEGEVVDIGTSISYVKWQEKNGMWLKCSESLATGVISSDGSTIYPLEEVEIEEITADEYESIKSILGVDEGTESTETDDTSDDTEDEDTSSEETEEDATLTYLRSVKIEEMSTACNAVIVNGVDVTLSDGVSHHFSLTLEDQINLISLLALITAGQESVPYHADGEECKYYSAADFTLITTAATAWKLYHESYFNSLKIYINAITDVNELAAVTYGIEIPEKYQTEVYQELAAQFAEV